LDIDDAEAAEVMAEIQQSFEHQGWPRYQPLFVLI
jgi:hypothetical protein